MSWFWAWNFANTLSVNDVIFAKRLTDITPYTDYIEKLTAIFAPDELDDIDTLPEINYPAYSSTNFLSDVYMTRHDYDTLVDVLKMKKNIILQGAPGVGKTFTAKRLAYSIIGSKNPERVQMIQFHQSYSYEDFIEGYRPTENGFTIKKGSFYKFCKLAEEDDENDYFFIIDEINRGNISKIFGELITLIEDSKREGEPEAMSVILPYSKEKFSVPKNVYILGTMNTADRSISLMDTALRRRFEFVEMMPDEDLLDEVVVEEGINIHEMLKIMNRRIEALYDREHTLGHAFFMSLKNEGKATINQLESIFKNKIIPLLQEYFYEDYEKIMLVLGIDPKNMDDSKFISVKSNDGLFKNSPEIDLNTTYQINNKAFEIPENYRNIYGSISNSGEADEN